MNVCVLTNIPQFIEPPVNENFIRIFSEYMDRYQNHNKESVTSCRGETFIMFNENLVSYFPDRVYNGKFSRNNYKPANCCSSTVNLSTKDNSNFAQPEPVYVYTDIIKSHLFGDSYVRLTSFALPVEYRLPRFD